MDVACRQMFKHTHTHIEHRVAGLLVAEKVPDCGKRDELGNFQLSRNRPKGQTYTHIYVDRAVDMCSLT